MRKTLVLISVLSLCTAATAAVVVIHEPRVATGEQGLADELANALRQSLTERGIEAVGSRELTSHYAAPPDGTAYLLLVGDVVVVSGGYYEYRWSLLDATSKTLALGELAARRGELARRAGDYVAAEVERTLELSGLSTTTETSSSPLQIRTLDGRPTALTLSPAASPLVHGPHGDADDLLKLRRYPLYELEADDGLTAAHLYYELLNRSSATLRRPLFNDPLSTTAPSALSANVLNPGERLRWRVELDDHAGVSLPRAVVRLDGPAGPEYAVDIAKTLNHYGAWTSLAARAGFSPTAAPGPARVALLDYHGRPVIYLRPAGDGELYALRFSTTLQSSRPPRDALLELLGTAPETAGSARVEFHDLPAILHYGELNLDGKARTFQTLRLDDPDGSVLFIFLQTGSADFRRLGDWAAHLLGCQ